MKKCICILLIVLILAGCSPYIKDEKNTTPINPVIDNKQLYKSTVTLYFMNESERLLAPDTRAIEIAPNERLEVAVLRELISGPSSDKGSLITLINPKTKVLSVQEQEDYLSVTLSKEFLDPPPYIPAKYEQDAQTLEYRRLCQRLAAYSIVNSLIQLSGPRGYSRVLLLVDMEGYGEGTRLTRKELGFTGDMKESQLIEPLPRQDDITLTAKKTVDLMFKAITGKQWEKAYSYISSTDTAGGTIPSFEEIEPSIQSSGLSFENYKLHDEVSTSADGKNATVFVDYKLNQGSITSTNYENIPVKLIQENETWKVVYESFITTMQLKK